MKEDRAVKMLNDYLVYYSPRSPYMFYFDAPDDATHGFVPEKMLMDEVEVKIGPKEVVLTWSESKVIFDIETSIWRGGSVPKT